MNEETQVCNHNVCLCLNIEEQAKGTLRIEGPDVVPGQQRGMLEGQLV